jgi:transcriptional regulator with XRE-family HTH domain
MNKKGPKKGSSFKEPKPYPFGQRLYTIRKRKGLTQKELAGRADTTVRAVSYYERQAKNPTLEVIERLAAALEVSPQLFIESAPRIEAVPQAPRVIKSLRLLLPELKKLPRKKQESLVVVIKGMLAEEHSERN